MEIVSEHEKYSRLIRLLEDIMDGSRLLIFLETKKGCDQVTRKLRMDGWTALSIHGDKAKPRGTYSYQNLRLARALL